jgi:hypothetical protein
VYRINWLRARVKKMRWDEEALLIKMEMDWTLTFFRHSTERWTQLASSASLGARCYAERKSDMYSGFASHAANLFEAYHATSLY